MTIPPLPERIEAIGQLRLSDATRKRTGGGFANFVRANAATLAQHLGGAIYPGSLNIEIGDPLGLQFMLDARMLVPACIIPRERLREMPRYLGDAAAWRAELHLGPANVSGWIFRRAGSRVPLGVVEFLCPHRLRNAHGLHDRDRVTLTLYAGPVRPP